MLKVGKLNCRLFKKILDTLFLLYYTTKIMLLDSVLFTNRKHMQADDIQDRVSMADDYRTTSISMSKMQVKVQGKQ